MMQNKFIKRKHFKCRCSKNFNKNTISNVVWSRELSFFLEDSYKLGANFGKFLNLLGSILIQAYLIF